MIIDIITIFPEMFTGILNSSIIKRTIEKDLITINIHDFRDFTTNKHKKVDDTIYGGGAGMLIQCQPVIDTLKSIPNYTNAYKIITSAQGNTFNQQKAKQLSKLDHIIIICGHYEGIDNRVLNYVDEEISIGDYILTGGEIPALAIIDSVIRLIPNAITDMSIEDESFEMGLLEYPQYTKPYEYDGYKVPDVLISGNHEEIRKYRKFESIKKTYFRRPDLLENNKLDKESLLFLENIKNNILEYNKIKK
jgi:tRNA (guanine37-N1)-methyltransferase